MVTRFCFILLLLTIGQVLPAQQTPRGFAELPDTAWTKIVRNFRIQSASCDYLVNLPGTSYQLPQTGGKVRYDKALRCVYYSFSNMKAERSFYNEKGQLIRVETSYDYDSTNILEKRTFTYDQQGRLQKEMLFGKMPDKSWHGTETIFYEYRGDTLTRIKTGETLIPANGRTIQYPLNDSLTTEIFIRKLSPEDSAYQDQVKARLKASINPNPLTHEDSIRNDKALKYYREYAVYPPETTVTLRRQGKIISSKSHGSRFFPGSKDYINSYNASGACIRQEQTGGSKGKIFLYDYSPEGWLTEIKIIERSDSPDNFSQKIVYLYSKQGLPEEMEYYVKGIPEPMLLKFTYSFYK